MRVRSQKAFDLAVNFLTQTYYDEKSLSVARCHGFKPDRSRSEGPGGGVTLRQASRAWLITLGASRNTKTKTKRFQDKFRGAEADALASIIAEIRPRLSLEDMLRRRSDTSTGEVHYSLGEPGVCSCHFPHDV